MRLPGVYWLRAYNAEGASGLRPYIVGTLPEVMEKEPNDEPRKAQKIEGSTVVVNGKLEKNGDVDCFAVELKKGQTLVASLEAHDTLRSPMDGMLQVLVGRRLRCRREQRPSRPRPSDRLHRPKGRHLYRSRLRFPRRAPMPGSVTSVPMPASID